MNGALLVAGLIKLIIGIGLGGLGVFLSWKVLTRMLTAPDALPLAENPAAGVLEASTLISLSLLVRQTLSALFDTIDLFMARGNPVAALPKIILLGGLHVGLALGLGSGLLAFGLWLFDRLTPGIDELALVRAGRVGPALVLGAILISLALLASPGLEAMLAGLIPYPELPSDFVVPHS